MLAAKALIGSGCKHLLIISGVSESIMPADARLKGFAKICDERGVVYKEVATSMNQYNSLDYHSLLIGELEQDKEIDGIFASSDLIAAQVLQVCRKCIPYREVCTSSCIR